MTVSRRDLLRVAAGAPALSLPLSSAAFAQSVADYPARPITSICMFAPGTGADIFVRFYANKLQELIGKPVLVENKVGAAGNIASEYVARARPDGYTIYIAPGTSVLAAAPSIFKKVNFDPIDDFEHITTLSKLAFVLTVAPDRPYKTMAEFVEFIRQKGDKASYGSSTHTAKVASEYLNRQFGLKAVEVKYRDGQSAINDMLAGNIDFFYNDSGTVMEHLRAGRLRALHTVANKRMDALPDIPGASEVGLPDMNLIAYWTVSVPAKTPQPILEKLQAWFNQIGATEDTKKFLNNLGWDPLVGNPRMAREILEREQKNWADYVKLANIEPQ